MSAIAGWIAPIATMIAAIMTAINLGPRITGWGFVVFTIGSLAWISVAIGTDQQNLLWTNGFLTLVNGVGIWRWLGRQARYQDGGEAAAARSKHEPVATLFSVSALSDAPLLDKDGETLGLVVDAMARCSENDLAYVVIRCGGIGGVGEELHALDPRFIRFSPDGVSCLLTKVEIAALPAIEPGNWPAAVAA